MKYGFKDAIAYILENEEVAQLTLNGKTRKYYLKDGMIFCEPNHKPHLTYKVDSFHVDAIMSTDWELL